MKSSRSSDEIVRFAHDEIKSVLFIPHVSADFIAQRFHPRSGFIPSVRTDLVEKTSLSRGFFWRRSRLRARSRFGSDDPPDRHSLPNRSASAARHRTGLTVSPKYEVMPPKNAPRRVHFLWYYSKLDRGSFLRGKNTLFVVQNGSYFLATRIAFTLLRCNSIYSASVSWEADTGILLFLRNKGALRRPNKRIK